MKRKDAINYVSFVVDDTYNGRHLHSDRHAIVRLGNNSSRDEITGSTGDESYEHPSILVGWQCGFEPLFVAVHSAYDWELDDEEAEDLAKDYLNEIQWFSGEIQDADYLIR